MQDAAPTGTWPRWNPADWCYLILEYAVGVRIMLVM